MENKKTSIFQAYKLYHNMGIVKDILLATAFSLVGSMFFGVFLLGADEEFRYGVIFFNSILCCIASSVNSISSPSKPKSFLYCFVMAFLGSLRILISICSSRACKVTVDATLVTITAGEGDMA